MDDPRFRFPLRRPRDQRQQGAFRHVDAVAAVLDLADAVRLARAEFRNDGDGGRQRRAIAADGAAQFKGTRVVAEAEQGGAEQGWQSLHGSPVRIGVAVVRCASILRGTWQHRADAHAGRRTGTGRRSAYPGWRP